MEVSSHGVHAEDEEKRGQRRALVHAHGDAERWRCSHWASDCAGHVSVHELDPIDVGLGDPV